MEREFMISFAGEDAAYVTDIQQQLNQQLQSYRLNDDADETQETPPNVWSYLDQPGGVRFHEGIRDRVSNAPALIVVLTNNSGAAPWVKEEVEWGREDGKDFVVIAQGDTDALKKTPVGRLLGNRVWINPAQLNPRHADEVDAVIEALETRHLIEPAIIPPDPTVRLGKRLTKRPYGGIYEGVLARDNSHVIVKYVEQSRGIARTGRAGSAATPD